jgi:2-haloacid dehalogenase
MMDWVKAITFDFWGTLVDIDTSGAEAMRQVLDKLAITGQDPAVLYLRWDYATVRRYRSDAWRPYVQWSALGLADTLEPLGVQLSPQEWADLADLFVTVMTSQAKPHPESTEVIRFLKTKVPLMPITNMDEDYFALNPFRCEFDQWLTAEEAHAFKPSAIIFNKAINKLGHPAGNILHASLAQFADLEGAMPVGMKVAWINRGSDALGPFTPEPLYEFKNLDGLKGLFV